MVGCLQETERKKREKQKKKKKKREKERRRKLREEGRVMVAGEEGSAHGGGGGGGGLAPLAAVQQPREGPAQPSLFGAEGSLVSAPGAPHDRDLWCDSQSQAVHTPFSLSSSRVRRARGQPPRSRHARIVCRCASSTPPPSRPASRQGLRRVPPHPGMRTGEGAQTPHNGWCAGPPAVNCLPASPARPTPHLN